MIVMNLIEKSQFWRKLKESTVCRNGDSADSEESLLEESTGSDSNRVSYSRVPFICSFLGDEDLQILHIIGKILVEVG